MSFQEGIAINTCSICTGEFQTSKQHNLPPDFTWNLMQNLNHRAVAGDPVTLLLWFQRIFPPNLQALRDTLWASLFYTNLPLQQNCPKHHSLTTPFTFTLFPQSGSPSYSYLSPPSVQLFLQDWVGSISLCGASQPRDLWWWITLPPHLSSEHHLRVTKKQITTFILGYWVLDRISHHHTRVPGVWEKGVVALIKWILWLSLTPQWPGLLR